MTDYTERSLDTLEYTGRSLGTTDFTGRGELDTTFCTTGTQTATDATSPNISNIHANLVGLTVVHLAWDTDEEANCRVYYGVASQTTNLTLMSVGGLHQHYVKTGRNYVVTGLPVYTYIYFFVESVDRYGNSDTSGYYKLRTASTNTVGVAPEQTE